MPEAVRYWTRDGRVLPQTSRREQSPANTLILIFRSPELYEKMNFGCFKSLRSWQFALSDLGNEHDILRELPTQLTRLLSFHGQTEDGPLPQPRLCGESLGGHAAGVEPSYAQLVRSCLLGPLQSMVTKA